MSDKPFLAAFLAAAHGVRISGAGTKETSYYTALDNLLDTIGETLKPKVRCVMQLKSLGAARKRVRPGPVSREAPAGSS